MSSFYLRLCNSTLTNISPNILPRPHPPEKMPTGAPTLPSPFFAKPLHIYREKIFVILISVIENVHHKLLDVIVCPTCTDCHPTPRSPRLENCRLFSETAIHITCNSALPVTSRPKQMQLACCAEICFPAFTLLSHTPPKIKKSI